MGREMNGQTCINGVYESRPVYSRNAFSEDRRVYIENGFVCLINDSDKEHVFRYDFFFKVNILGERIGDIPDGFKVKAI